MALSASAYALSGRSLPLVVTQGAAALALGYELTAPAGRSVLPLHHEAHHASDYFLSFL